MTFLLTFTNKTDVMPDKIKYKRKDKKTNYRKLDKKWYKKYDGGSKSRDIGKVYTIKEKDTLPDGTKVKSKIKIYGERRNKLKKMVRGNGVRMKSKSISPDGQVRKVIKNKDKGWNN